jgi:hypothetical protein
MNAPRAIIAEDEPLLRAEIRRTLSELWPQLEVCAEASGGFEHLSSHTTRGPCTHHTCAATYGFINNKFPQNRRCPRGDPRQKVAVAGRKRSKIRLEPSIR